MKYPVQIDGFEGQSIEIKTAGFFSGAKLFTNGEPAPKGAKRNQMVIRRTDGREAVATWKPQFFGLDIPQLSVEGQTISVVEPLKWFEWAWIALPILLIFGGGALGAVAGVIGFAINAKIFRSSMTTLGKYLVTGVVSISTFLVFIVAAALLLAVLG